ncbi:hypothetical protein AZH11_22530 [Pseudomonas simiae]|nr:hypothetical protein AZH11_22530 [Pseudomonas simiae]
MLRVCPHPTVYTPQAFSSGTVSSHAPIAPLHVETGNAVEISTGGQFSNSGHISTGPSKRFKESYNAISLNRAGGTVVNQGVVAGGSNGIKATDEVAFLNTGILTGHKGAGLKSKGDARVINYGIITGADTRRSRQNDGDGDGLDIDKRAQVHNYGIIQGTGANGEDKNGAPNSSEGIAMGGGEIYNYGVIRGAHHGVLVDNGDLGPAYAQTLLINEGTLSGHNGYGMKLVGDFNDRVTNNGLISGANGVALDMGGGDDELTVRSGAHFEGKVDGGSGTNQVILDDARGGTFNGAIQMQHLRVSTGTWTLTGALDANQQGKVYSNATLVNQSRIGGSIEVEPDATYSGGTVDTLNVAGTLLLNPANKNRTRIKHDLQMGQGSTLTFTIGKGEAHNTLKVGNQANLDGATLTIHVEDENDELLTRQLRIVDAGQINGQFADISSNLKTLTPTLIYTPNGLFIGFKRKAPVGT